jgi:dolichyl-phosphate-mannose--protein O-mannosyl transferase
VWDERHFVVKGARNYLEHKADGNEHPPFAKLLLALAIACFGDRSAVWRLPSLLAGTGIVAVSGLLARLLFRDRLAGALTAMLVALDGFFIAYSRTACIDSTLVLCFLLSAYWMLRAQGFVDLALGAFFAGLALSTKFTGGVLVVPLALSLIVHRRRLPWFTFVVLALVPTVYFAVYTYGLWLAHRPLAPWAETLRIFRIQKGLTDWTHPWLAHWSTWWLPAHPMPLATTRIGKHAARVMVSLPNLAVSWPGFALGMTALCRIATLGPRRIQARIATAADGFFQKDLGAVCWLVLLWILPVVPWMLFHRDSYFNHYLPAYAFLVVLVGGALARLFRSHPLLAWLYVAAVIAVFLLYLPVWIELPIRLAHWRELLFLEELWRWTGGPDPIK